jgi:hypothetical protein
MGSCRRHHTSILSTASWLSTLPMFSEKGRRLETRQLSYYAQEIPAISASDSDAS